MASSKPIIKGKKEKKNLNKNLKLSKENEKVLDIKTDIKSSKKKLKIEF